MMERNHIDIWALIVVLALMVLSLGVVYSASAEWAYARFENLNHYFNLHLIKVLLSFGALLVGINVPYKIYQRFSKPLLILSILFLMLTLILGGESKGAVRWLRLGGLGFQPSELAKFALLFHLATLLATKKDMVKNWKHGFVPMMIWIVIVVGLVLLQPNFSTAAMIFLLSFLLLFIGGVSVLHLGGTLLAAVPLLIGYALLAPYRLERIRLFFYGSSNGKINYQLRQGIIAFGNGGLFGVGVGESRQRDLFLPESYNDFVYSIIGEEYGFIGTIAVLLAFAFILFRGYRIARHAKDEYGMYLAYAITSTVALYAVVNASVAVGLLPTTGLPMPFISYGGSAMLMTAFAMGVLLNISAYTDLHPRLHYKMSEEENDSKSVGVGRVY
ncbi:MAG TPA: putative lipid II flippase FtsW [Bacteroidota bacterium]|nr:putative lipid II flippase FtsW [Bacteroidota bacterium]